MNRLTFFVPGVPVPKGSAKAFINKRTGRAIVTQTNRDKQQPWASLIAFVAKEKGGAIIDGPVSLTVHFFMPRPKNHYGTGKNSAVLKTEAPLNHTSKPDLDKLLRCVKDALTGVVWNDDSQVCWVECRKQYSKQPGATIEVRRAEHA